MGETRCFECGHELTAPYCPACRPAPSLPEDVERVVERLQSAIDGLGRTGVLGIAPPMRDALALIQSLSSQLAEVRAERDHWLGETQRLLKSGQDALDKLEAAEADRDRLAAALRAMLKEHDILSGNFGDVVDPKHVRPDRWPNAASLARAALASLEERT